MYATRGKTSLQKAEVADCKRTAKREEEKANSIRSLSFSFTFSLLLTCAPQPSHSALHPYFITCTAVFPPYSKVWANRMASLKTAEEGLLVMIFMIKSDAPNRFSLSWMSFKCEVESVPTATVGGQTELSWMPVSGSSSKEDTSEKAQRVKLNIKHFNAKHMHTVSIR